MATPPDFTAAARRIALSVHARRKPALEPEDLAQEAWFALDRAGRAYDAAKGPWAKYAGTCVYNRLADVLRALPPRCSADVPERSGREPEVGAELEAAELCAVLLARVPWRGRVVVRLRYWEGWTWAEIGAALGVSAAAACQEHRRAVAGMRMAAR